MDLNRHIDNYTQSVADEMEETLAVNEPQQRFRKAYENVQVHDLYQVPRRIQAHPTDAQAEIERLRESLNIELPTNAPPEFLN